MPPIRLDAVALTKRLDSASTVSLDGPQASVAAVFRSGVQGTELLFIQRATKASDPWSGHMAFPGGRCDPDDRDTLATAVRETREEIALDLTAATRIGSLSPLVPTNQRGGLSAIHAFGFWLAGPRPDLTPNYEVAGTVWVPLCDLVDPDRFIDYYYPANDATWPGIQLDHPDQVVWGLTLRFLGDLFTRLEQPFIALAPWD